MTNQSEAAVNHIIADFKHLKAGQDFTGPTSELISLVSWDKANLKQDLAAVNRGVDFKKLGFPDDFSIVGAANGQMLTKSHDGRSYDLRTVADLGQIVGHAPASVKLPTDLFAPLTGIKDGGKPHTAGDMTVSYPESTNTNATAGTIANTSADTGTDTTADTNPAAAPREILSESPQGASLLPVQTGDASAGATVAGADGQQQPPVNSDGSAVPAAGADAASQDGPLQAIGDRGRQAVVHPDGSMTYTAQANNGDCYWRVAADVLKSRSSGQAPSDTDVENYVGVLAKYNSKSDPNLLAVSEKIEIPPPTPASAGEPNAAADANGAPTGTGPTADSPQSASGALNDTTGTNVPGVDYTPAPAVPKSDEQLAADASQPAAAPATTTDASQPAAAPATTTDASQPAAAPAATTDAPQLTPAVAPVLTPMADILKPKDDAFNPIAPPGQGMGEFGAAWQQPQGMTASRVLNNEKIGDNGVKTDTYSGYLENGTFGNNMFATSYVAAETVDAKGALTERGIFYASGSVGLPTIKFESKDGGVISIDQVEAVSTKLDPSGSGNYDTTINTGLGEQWRAVSKADGTVASFIQTNGWLGLPTGTTIPQPDSPDVPSGAQS